jgi:hypothetical protein
MGTQPRIRFILGARDPEIVVVESLLRAAGISSLGATRWGHPVGNMTAYEADSPWIPKGQADVVGLVECGGPIVSRLADVGVPEVILFDHHRPGDRGHGRPPEEFFQASSVGQVAGFLVERGLLGVCELEPFIEDAWHAAAADHCLAAAYRGRCPGVDPRDLIKWRAGIRSSFQGLTLEEFERNVARAGRYVSSPVHPRIMLGGKEVVDLRPIGVTVPEIPEAAARDGIAFLAEVDGADGERKVILQVSDGRAIRVFLGGWADAQGYGRLYGDPARGICGGYRQGGGTWDK